MSTARSRIWPFLLLLLAPALPLWRCIALGQAIGPFDQIRQMSPWNGSAPSRPWDVLQADGVLQFFAWRDLVFSAWGARQLPFWNPYELAGTPLLANSQSAGLYPPHIVLGLAHVPTPLAIVILAWAHLAWAGFGIYRLVRSLGGTRTGGAVAGVSFSLSPFMLAWTALPSVISTVAWIPWVLWGVTSLFDAEVGRRWPFRIAALAASVAMMVLAGLLQFVAYGGLAAILFAVGLTFVRRPSAMGWVRIMAAAGLGLLLAAPQLLPVLKFAEFSHRRGAPTAEGYAAYQAEAIPVYAFGALPFAPLTGQPFESSGPPVLDARGGAHAISDYFPAILRLGNNYAEFAASTGLLVLSLLFLAPWRKGWRKLLPASLVGCVAVLLAAGTPLNRLFYDFVPGWSASGSPGRAIVLFVLTACVVAGVSIGELPRLADRGVRRIVPLLVPAFLGALGAYLVLSAPIGSMTAPSVPGMIRAAIQSAAPGLLAVIVVSAASLAVAYHLEKLSSRLVLLAAPFLLAIAAGALSLVPTGDPSFLSQASLRPPDPSERVAIVNLGWELLVAAPALFPPDTPVAARIHDLSGYDSLVHRDSVALLRDIDGDDPAPGANGNMMFVKPGADPAKLADAGVTEVWSRREMPQLNSAPVMQGDVFRYRIAGPGRASTPAGPARIERETSTQLVVRATGPGRLIVRDRNMPGWLVKVDGRHVPLLGTTWREVDIPPGADHRVEFSYIPPGFSVGLLAAAFAILVICILVGVGYRNSRESTDELNGRGPQGSIEREDGRPLEGRDL